KMNNGPSAAKAFMDTFLAGYASGGDRTIIIFPPAVSLTTVAAAVIGRDDVLSGVQNLHWAEKGAFTGETSAPMAKDAGARVALVGHSERRHVFGETDAQCAKKCLAASRAKMAFMLCVGETIQQREAGETERVVTHQLREGVSQTPNLISADFLLAYEPVWAIGTGLTASAGDASAIHTVLRSELRQMIGTRSDDIPILYGGSVSQSNAATLLAAPEVDGLLVGGASVEASSWLAIAQTVHRR
ncbi:MAG TPA: triose-phosphate isomerase, partial [Gemmatimonadaceae bacterium]|nr:triose-phosphate isomerase [Gemmatimonadaceae bacterium]